MRTPNSLSLKTAVPAVLIALAACITVAAASQDVVVKVPFDFQAGQTQFAAGEYVLSMDKVMTGAIMIRSADRNHRAILLARKSTSPGYGTNPTVSFRSYGDSRFLIAVQSEGADRWELVPSSNETALARAQGAAGGATLRASSSSKN